MTERSNTAIETAEAIIGLLGANRPDEKNSEVGAGFEHAILIVRVYAASLRLHQQPAKRGRRPNASKGGE